MSNWRLNFQRLFQVLCKPLINLWRRLQGSPARQLAKTCKTLQQQLANSQPGDKAWQTYTKALSLARKCDRTALTKVVIEFDSQLGEATPHESLAVGQAISFLLESKPQTAQNLDAAWRLARRSSEPSSIREVQQQICLQLAQMGDSNTLLAKLLKRRNEGLLTSAEISPIIHKFLEENDFQQVDPWKAFLEEFELEELPQIHQVYAVLDRYVEASELAAAAKDYRSAIRYLMPMAGKEIALRILDWSERWGDEQAIARSHQKLAEILLQESNYLEALKHFQAAGDRERALYCYQILGQLAGESQPDLTRTAPSSATATAGNHLTPQTPSTPPGELNILRNQFLQLLSGDRDTCQRLIAFERQRSPHKSEAELYRDAIDRLQRDRGY